MDKTSASPMEQTNLNPPPLKEKSWSKIGLVGGVVFFLGFLVASLSQQVGLLNKLDLNQKFIGKQDSVKEEKKKAEFPFARIVVGKFEPFPRTSIPPRVISITPEGKVTAIDPETTKTKLLSISMSCCGGGFLAGVSTPLISPLRTKIAYVDKEDNNIWVVDVEGNRKVKVSSQAMAGNDIFRGSGVWIAGWSSDDKWLVYHIDTAIDGIGVSYEDYLAETPVLDGFYAADLVKGETHFLAGVPNFVDFIPGSDLLVFNKEVRREGKLNKEYLYSYDLSEGAIALLIPQPISGTFVGGFSFFPDQKHFAYVVGEPEDPLSAEENTSRLIYASYDGRESRELIGKGFADIGSPHISPNSKLIAFGRSRPASCPSGGGGCPKSNLAVYNLETSEIKELGEIKGILFWYDDNHIVTLEGPYIGPWSLQTVDVRNGETKTLAPNEKLRNE